MQHNSPFLSLMYRFHTTSSIFFKVLFVFLPNRDPHLYRTITNKGDVRINRSKNLEWSRYDPNYKKYLSIGEFAAELPLSWRKNVGKPSPFNPTHAIGSINNNGIGMTMMFFTPHVPLRIGCA